MYVYNFEEEKEEAITQDIQEDINNKKDFINYLLDKIDKNLVLQDVYKSVIPNIQKIKKIQKQIKQLNRIYENNKVKDYLSKIQEYNDAIQIEITSIITLMIMQIT